MDTAGIRRLLFAAKVLFGVLLLWLLIATVDGRALLNSLASVDPIYLLITFVIPHLMVAASAVRWQLYLDALGHSISFGRLFALYLVATFFNNFLPTMAGGDAVRMVLLGRERADMSAVAAATLMERLVGLAVLVALIPLALLAPHVTNAYPAVWLIIPAICLAFATGLVVMSSSKWVAIGRWLERFGFLQKIIAFAGRTRQAFGKAVESRKALLGSLGLSLLFYAGAAATVWSAAKALNCDVDPIYLFCTVPLVLIAGMMPISLNGLGITEAGFAVILQLAGVPPVEAVAVGLIIRARLLITSVIGGLLFLGLRSRPATVQGERAA